MDPYLIVLLSISCAIMVLILFSSILRFYIFRKKKQLKLIRKNSANYTESFIRSYSVFSTLPSAKSIQDTVSTLVSPILSPAKTINNTSYISFGKKSIENLTEVKTNETQPKKSDTLEQQNSSLNTNDKVK